VTGFFVDATEQREKARRAEQKLLERDATRAPRRPRLDEVETEVTDGIAPVFLRDGVWERSRETSIERRAMRFRDGLPPPEPEVAPDAIGRVLPPPPPVLVDRRRKDAHGAGLSPGRADELTHSQKKRLRRKRNRAERQQDPAAPYGDASGRLPPSPTPTDRPVRESCDAACILRFPDETTQRVVCRLTPFPHPNQPHLVQIRDAHGRADHAAEIFVGFWLPGE
jgi:hypothetical protein